MEVMMVASTLRGALAGAREKIDRKRLLQESQILMQSIQLTSF